MKRTTPKKEQRTSSKPTTRTASANRKRATKQKEGAKVMLDEMLKLFKGGDKLTGILLDPNKPAEMRAKMLLDVLTNHANNQAAQHALLTALLQHVSALAPEAEVAKLKEYYEQALIELEQGPARPATFIAEADGEMPGPKPRVHVITPDGQERFPALHPQVRLEQMVPGMTLYLDAKGALVVGMSRTLPLVGQETTFLRRLPDSSQIEAAVRDEKIVLYGAKPVLDAVEAGELTNGDRLLMCPRRQFAFSGIPAEKDHRYRFVDRDHLPEVIAARDIGKPHWVLSYMIRRTRILLFRPDLHERWDLRPRFTVLLTGPTGTGKTLTLRAFLHEFARLLIERTGREDLGSRVIRVKVSQLLSEWLGRSDKNVDELFDDIHAIASEEIETQKGERLHLPVVVILEEVEGIARRRGEYDGAIYDRIIGTLLQRLDDPTHDLGKLPLILITTSNRPDLIDSAMWRRLAGVRARFGRLDREGLAAVLGKKLKPHYPFAARNGHPPDQLRRHLIDQVTAWLFSPNGDDQGLVEITLRDGKKLTKHRRDFLTGAVVEQAISNIIDQTVFAEEEAGQPVSLTGAGLIDALRKHIDGLADNLTAFNVADYVDVPEHVSVAAVRRLRNTNGHLAALVVEEV